MILALLFLFLQRSFLLNTLVGDFPPQLLAAILPTLVREFFFADTLMTIHYLLIALLASVYVVLLVYLFRTRRHISLAGMGVGFAGLLGISLGVTCISCGALAGLLLVSALGASSVPALLSHENIWLLVVGEALLGTSVLIVLYAVKRLG